MNNFKIFFKIGNLGDAYGGKLHSYLLVYNYRLICLGNLGTNKDCPSSPC